MGGYQFVEMDYDKLIMRRVMELAFLGKGSVSPNPLVGCVVTYDQKIIGEGYHQNYGHSHAEVNAINSVVDKSLLSKATLYVNLEPCSHHGKTPPCADLLIDTGIKKVVIANLDTNPKVSGEGIKKLKNAGIEVVTDVLQAEGRELNKRFFTFIEKKRPYTILKWAETADSFIASENHGSKWISNDYSRQLVHKWRAEEDAVMIGTKTAIYDNPKLNVRDWSGKNPTRIVIDRTLKLPKSLNLFDGNQPTLCYNLSKEDSKDNLAYIKLEETNFFRNMVNNIMSRNIQSVIVEGGAFTINSWVENNCWDEARIFRSPKAYNKGVKAPIVFGDKISEEKIFDDSLITVYHSEK